MFSRHIWCFAMSLQKLSPWLPLEVAMLGLKTTRLSQWAAGSIMNTNLPSERESEAKPELPPKSRIHRIQEKQGVLPGDCSGLGPSSLLSVGQLKSHCASVSPSEVK